MTDFFGMVGFHFRQYLRNSYFVTLILTSTATVLLLSYLTRYENHELLQLSDVLRASLFGMWSSAVTSAGSLHFQRAQGTLVQLLNSAKSSVKNVLALMFVPASFGLLSIPVAYLLAGILNGVRFVAFQPLTYLYLLAFLLGAISLSFVIASLFVLTRNAFTYEGLLLVPIMLISGLISVEILPLQGNFVGKLLPITYPVQLLLGNAELTGVSALMYVVTLVIWAILAYHLFQVVLKRAKIAGSLEVF